MTNREGMIVNWLMFAFLMVLLACGEGCTQVVHSDDPNFEYPKTYKELIT
jgi:hypothetical protein